MRTATRARVRSLVLSLLVVLVVVTALVASTTALCSWTDRMLGLTDEVNQLRSELDQPPQPPPVSLFMAWFFYAILVAIVLGVLAQVTFRARGTP